MLLVIHQIGLSHHILYILVRLFQKHRLDGDVLPDPRPVPLEPQHLLRVFRVDGPGIAVLIPAVVVVNLVGVRADGQAAQLQNQLVSA